MNIYYRGYVISEDFSLKPACTVQGTRPDRRTLAFEDNPRSAMRWIDHEVLRRKVENAGWLSPRALSA